MQISYHHHIMEDQMKHKLILGLIVSSTVSMQSYALEIHGGKLISHKEWTTGNAIQSFSKELSSSGLSRVPLHDVQQNENISVVVSSHTDPLNDINISTNKEVIFTGSDNVWITNNSDIQKVYTVTAALLTTAMCSIHTPIPPSNYRPAASKMAEDVIILDPKGSVWMNKGLSLTTSFGDANCVGQYRIDVSVHDNTTSTGFYASGDAEEFRVVEAKK